ncbi:MAG: pyridoxal-phosphate dependent enzyme, partial [Acidimicrobiia bacterium]
MIHESIVETIGETPIVRLSRLHRRGNLVAKVETFNPGGSVKERIALAMLEDAEKSGLLEPGGTIIEPTSGNTGVGLAIVAAIRGYNVICTVPDKVSKEKQDLLRAYGVKVIETPTSLGPGDPDSYYGVANRLAGEIEGSFQPNQYLNEANPRAHYETTGPEIWRQTEGRVGVLVAGVGTGGTITGAGRYLKEQNAEVEVVGADPEGSIYTSGPDGDIHQYLVEGVGEDFYPETVDLEVIDRFLAFDDAASFAMARRLARVEGILTGGSGGLAVAAALQVASEDDRLVVVIIPDSGRGYLSK